MWRQGSIFHLPAHFALQQEEAGFMAWELKSQKLSIQRALKIREGRKMLPDLPDTRSSVSVCMPLRDGNLILSGTAFLTSTVLLGRKHLLSELRPGAM